jgi:multiple sugar transport system permease protein
MNSRTAIKIREYGRSGGRFTALSVFLLVALFPLYWVVATSLKDPRQIYTFPLIYWPKVVSFAGYRKLFGFANFWNYFRNSLTVALAASVGALIICVLSGFALSRIHSRTKRQGLLLVLYFTQVIPGFLLMTPLFLMLSTLGATDNLGSLAVVYMASMVAFGTIMSKSFFDRIPQSIEEAAMIDGCGPLNALFRVILPISLPGLFAIFSFTFVNIWNELFLAVILLSSEGKMTVPVALNSFISKAGVSWDVMSSGIVMALLPTIIVFGIGQKYIVAGLTEGGVKG